MYHLPCLFSYKVLYLISVSLFLWQMQDLALVLFALKLLCLIGSAGRIVLFGSSCLIFFWLVGLFHFIFIVGGWFKKSICAFFGIWKYSVYNATLKDRKNCLAVPIAEHSLNICCLNCRKESSPRLLFTDFFSFGGIVLFWTVLFSNIHAWKDAKLIQGSTGSSSHCRASN